MIKKSIFTLMLMAVMGYVSAQSLQFELDGQVFEDGQMVYCLDFNPDFGEYIQDMQLRNISGQDLNVVVEREILTLSEGSLAYFCWGMCFSPDVSVSPNPVPMAAGELSGDGALAFHFMPNSSSDRAIVKYYAYDERNSDERVSIVIAYNTSENVEDNTLSMKMGLGYPNPANLTVSFDYNLSGSNATAVVYNLVGQEVMRQEINTFDGKMNLSVAELNDGIYFCSVMRNGQTLATIKFVVKK